MTSTSTNETTEKSVPITSVLPIVLTSDVSGILPTANGGAGGLSNGRIPFVASGVFTSSSGLFFSSISGDLGVGGTPFRRIEAVTQSSNDGIRIRTTSGSHNALMEIDAHGSALYTADRGNVSSESAIRHLNAGSLKWTAGMLDSSGNYSIKNSARATPDLFISTANGNIGFGGSEFQSGAQVMFLANRTAAPTLDPLTGLILYSEGGVLKYRGSAGIITLSSST